MGLGCMPNPSKSQGVYGNEDGFAFIVASEEGHMDVVKLLMYNLQIDLDSTQRKIAFSRQGI